MSNVEVKFNFDTDVDAKNFFCELHLRESAEHYISSFQCTLYDMLKIKKHPKDTKLLKELLNQYNDLFSDFVSPIPDDIDIEQEKLKEKST